MRQPAHVLPDDLSTWLWAAGINKERYRGPLRPHELRDAKNVMVRGH